MEEKRECVISIWTQLSAAISLLLFKGEWLFGSLIIFVKPITFKKATNAAFCLMFLEFNFILKAASVFLAPQIHQLNSERH